MASDRLRRTPPKPYLRAIPPQLALTGLGELNASNVGSTRTRTCRYGASLPLPVTMFCRAVLIGAVVHIPPNTRVLHLVYAWISSRAVRGAEMRTFPTLVRT